MTELEEPAEIDPVDGERFGPGSRADREIELSLVAEIRAPEVGGAPLQATSVAMHGNRAIVSYHMRGEPYVGAIDVIEIRSRGAALKCSAVFMDTDITAISFDDGYVYAAEATFDPDFEDPAVVEVIRLDRDKLVLDHNARVPLTSFVGTCNFVDDDRINATSGDTDARVESRGPASDDAPFLLASASPSGRGR